MWQGINIAKKGNLPTHDTKKDMSFKLPDGKMTKTDKVHMSIMEPHCIKIFNNHKQVSPQALEKINQRETTHELDNPIKWEEFERAVSGMHNDKSPGANKIPCEAFKAMDETN